MTHSTFVYPDQYFPWRCLTGHASSCKLWRADIASVSDLKVASYASTFTATALAEAGENTLSSSCTPT